MLNEDADELGKLKFGLLSAEDIKSMAVCKITAGKTLEEEPGSVYDRRMGFSTSSKRPCPTCGLKTECWGHMGYVELVEPVLHPMLYKYIVIFLKCFCKSCHKLLLLSEQIELSGFSKLKEERKVLKILEKLAKVDFCPHCSAPQPEISFKQKEMRIDMILKTKKKKGDGEKVAITLSAEDIKKIFDDVSSDDVKLLGLDPTLTHPKSLVLTVLPVIPPCSRPAVIADGKPCDDDLTTQYMEIVKNNNNLAKALDLSDSDEKKQEKITKYRQILKFRISTLMNNQKGKAKHPTNSRPLKALKERLVGKGGRIRCNLMGKRVDFSARTVIDADPTLKTGQVGIPYEVAQILTKPEMVTAFNIDWLTDIVNRGEANFVVTTEKGKKVRKKLQYAMFGKKPDLVHGDIIYKGEGRRPPKDDQGNLYLKGYTPLVHVVTGDEPFQEGDTLIRNGKVVEAERKLFKLKIGDVVERHLTRGSIVLINRQP